MSEGHKPRGKRRALEATIGVVLLAAVVGTAWYLRSQRFKDRVRAKVIAEIEQVTGGRVELRSLDWNLSRLRFEAHDLTVHGLEGPNEAPYAHAGRLLVRAKIISLFQREIGLRYVAIEHPVVHLIVYPDGSTNQPVPKVKQQGGGTAAEPLFHLRINRLDVSDGQVILNDRKMPLDFSAREIDAAASYDFIEKRYDGGMRVGKIDTKLENFRPFASQAELKFSLYPNALQLTTVTLTSGRSRVQARGQLRDFNAPKLELTYTASLNLGEVAATARVPEVRGGVLEVAGSGTFSAQELKTAGKLLVKELAYRDASLKVSEVTAGAQFSADRERLTLAHIFAHALGGAVTGSAEVRNWIGGSDEKQQQGTAQLKIESVLVSRLAAAVSTPSWPLERMNLAGTGSGTVEARWRGTPAKGDYDVALRATPPAQAAAEQLPVNATLRGMYRGASQTLEIAELNLTTRSTRLNATGALGPTAELRMAVTTNDLGEFKPVLAALQGAPKLPIELHGQASFTGTARGKVTQPALAGHLQISDFNSLLSLTLAPVQKPRPQRVHWDLLTADVQYSPTQAGVRNGVLKHGSAEVNFDFTAGLTRGEFKDASPLTARVDLRNADVAEVQALAGYSYPVTGTMDFAAQIAGTKLEPQGQGRLQITKATVYGEPVASITTDVLFAGNEAQLRNLDIAHGNEHVTGTAAYNLTTAAFGFDLRGRNIQLGRLRKLQRPNLSAQGLVSFAAQGSGTKEAPIINADVELHNLVVNGEPLGDVRAQAVTHGADLRLTARSNSKLGIEGTVRLRGDYAADVTLHFARLDIDPLLRPYLGAHISGHSSATGDVQLRGPLARPRELYVQGDLSQFVAEVEHLRLHNDGPIRFHMADQVATLERARLLGDGTDLTASGTVNFAGAQGIMLRADGHASLKLLQNAVPNLTTEGMATIAMGVRGTLSRPALEGKIDVVNGAVSHADLPNGLSDLNGTLVFDENRMRVESLTGRSGGGSIEIGGYIAYPRALRFNLTARGDGIRLRYPPGVSSMADANLRLSGTPNNATLSGDVVMTKFSLNPQFDVALYLASSKQPSQLTNVSSPLSNVKFDIHITSTPELQVQTSLAKISGNADLRLRGTALRPVMLGRVNVIEGDIFFNGTKYHLERGDIVFANPTGITPVLDLEATARVRDYDITIGLHGAAETRKLNVSYRSDPPLPTGDIIALLALGRTREDTTLAQQSSATVTESASNAILGQALNEVVSSRVQRLFGVSRIKIDPQVGGPENNPNARLTIEQQVSNNITLTYITDLTRSNQQSIQVEYNVNRNVSIIAVRDQNGVVGFDVRIRQRKK